MSDKKSEVDELTTISIDKKTRDRLRIVQIDMQHTLQRRLTLSETIGLLIDLTPKKKK